MTKRECRPWRHWEISGSPGRAGLAVPFGPGPSGRTSDAESTRGGPTSRPFTSFNRIPAACSRYFELFGGRDVMRHRIRPFRYLFAAMALVLAIAALVPAASATPPG